MTPTDGPQLELQWEVELLREIQGLHKECRERGRRGSFLHAGDRLTSWSALAEIERKAFCLMMQFAKTWIDTG